MGEGKINSADASEMQVVKIEPGDLVVLRVLNEDVTHKEYLDATDLLSEALRGTGAQGIVLRHDVDMKAYRIVEEGE